MFKRYRSMSAMAVVVTLLLAAGNLSAYPLASTGRSHNQAPRRDTDGNFLLLRDPGNSWGNLIATFNASGVTYTDMTHPIDLQVTDLSGYDVIWEDGNASNAWYDSLNANRAYVDAWVSQGGVLYVNDGTPTISASRPIHPGGLTYYTSYQHSPNYTAVPKDSCSLYIAMNWNQNTALNCTAGGKFSSYVYYRAADLAAATSYYQILATSSAGAGFPTMVHYRYGKGHVVVTGTPDAAAYNDIPHFTWGQTSTEIFNYLMALKGNPFVPLAGKFLLLRDPTNSWGNVEIVFQTAGVDYDTMTVPGNLSTTNMSIYDVVWVDGNSADAWYDSLNANRVYIDRWVSKGGVLYESSGDATPNAHKPIHPGGLTYNAAQNINAGYTNATEAACALFDSLNWAINTHLTGTYVAYVRYDVAQIALVSQHYQILITSGTGGTGFPEVVRYSFGHGQVVVSGTGDAKSFNGNDTWGSSKFHILDYLMDLTTQDESTAPSGKFLYLYDPSNAWGTSEVVFDGEGVDYDLMTDPHSLRTTDLSIYNVIWVGGNASNAWYDSLNANRQAIDRWVSRGGALYSDDGMAAVTSHRPIHPGGMAYNAFSTLSAGYTNATPAACSLFNSMSWAINTQLTGTYVSYVAFDPAQIANVSQHYQLLVTTGIGGGGSPTLVRYNYGHGQVVVSGTGDELAFNSSATYTWGKTKFAILDYLRSLNSLDESNPPSGKYLLVADPTSSWGTAEPAFQTVGADYDGMFSPDSLALVDLSVYAVIWVDGNASNAWDSTYNANRRVVGNWVAHGGTLYHSDGTLNTGVTRIISPGGLTFFGAVNASLVYTTPTQALCPLMDSLNFNPNQTVTGTYVSYVRYRESDFSKISSDYQLLMTSSPTGSGNTIAARYGYGLGQVVISGIGEQAYNTASGFNWAPSRFYILGYLKGLSSMPDPSPVLGKYLLVWDPADPWGGPQGVFDQNQADYDVVSDPNDLGSMDLSTYDVIWVAENGTDVWNTTYNQNEPIIEDWVNQGGVLYHCAAKDSTMAGYQNVRPIHPGGLTFARTSSLSAGNTAIAFGGCSLFAGNMNWPLHTALNGSPHSRVRYDSTSVGAVATDDDWENLVLIKVAAVFRQDLPVTARYKFGRGQVIISGSDDGEAFNTINSTWGNVRKTILQYLYSLTPAKSPKITVYPSSLDYGNVEYNRTKDKQFYIFNEGSDTLNINNMVTSGVDAADFDDHYTGPFAVLRGVGATITVTMTSDNSDTGNTSVGDTASIAIVSDDPANDTLNFNLLGTSVWVNPDVLIGRLQDSVQSARTSGDTLMLQNQAIYLTARTSAAITDFGATNFQGATDELSTFNTYLTNAIASGHPGHQKGDPMVAEATFIKNILFVGWGVSSDGGHPVTSPDLIPTTVELRSAYPNPFNATTRISFGLPKAGLVDMQVFDLMGRSVGTLAHGYLQAGYHTLSFNGLDLNSGAYFVRMTTLGQAKIQKLILIK